MSGNAQQDYVTSILTLLAQQRFLPGNMTLDGKQKFEADLSARAEALMTHYENEREATAQLPADDPRRKAFDDATESLAKALPSIAKGTLDAISAFQRGDAITGSAAVMDICAALAPLLGALSAAGGPPGMLIGALFALIGMILSFFAPKSESLTAQMEKLLRDLEAERGLQDIHAAHQNITNYAAALSSVSSRIGSTLDATGELQAKVLTQIIGDLNPIDGPTMTLFWEVAEWLQEPKNQDVDLWPTVLGGVCQAYTELLTAVIKLMSLVSTDAMQKRFDEADKLAPEDRHDVREALTNLQAVTIARLIEFGACGDAQLGYLKRAVPAAQDRGRMWAIDDGARQHLWNCTSIRKGGFTYLGGESKRITMAETRQELGSPNPTFHGFALEPWIDQGYSGYDRTYHCVVNPPYDSMQSTQVDNDAFSLHALTDIWATPGTAGNAETDVLFYVAKNTDIRGFVMGADNSIRPSYARTVKSKANTVRVVHNPRSFDADPDMGRQISGSTAPEYITYGGLAEAPDIYVDAGGSEGYVPSPWTRYDGVEVDQHYLWAFGSGGFACATHASVLRCLKGEIKNPRWMAHYPDGILYTDAYRQDQNKVQYPDKPFPVWNTCRPVTTELWSPRW